MAIKKVKPDPRFTGSKENRVAAARGTEIKKEQNITPMKQESQQQPQAQLPTSNLNNVTPAAGSQTFTPIQPLADRLNEVHTSNLGNVTPTAGLQTGITSGTGEIHAAEKPGIIEQIAGGIKGTLTGTGNPEGSGLHQIGRLIPSSLAAILGSVIAAAQPVTAIAEAATIGGTGYSVAANTAGSLGTAGTFAANTATTAVTASWLTKVFKSSVAPAAVASATMGAIGSYPFAGFIKEEALQTIGFAVNSAIKAGDQEGALRAIEFQKEILNPDSWAEITGKVPYANVLHNLKLFYEAAQIKLSIDEKIVQDMNLGETEDKKYARIAQEQADQDKAAVDYYNKERKKLLEWENQARTEQRDKDAAFWAQEAAKQRKYEEEDRKAIAQFWEAYRKRMQKISDDSRPSNLNFGLI